MSIVYKDSRLVLSEWTAHFDQMCWPRNCKALFNLNRKLRYEEVTRSDILMAAEVIGAYMALIDKPDKKRTKIINMLKLAETIMSDDEENP